MYLGTKLQLASLTDLHWLQFFCFVLFLFFLCILQAIKNQSKRRPGNEAIAKYYISKSDAHLLHTSQPILQYFMAYTNCNYYHPLGLLVVLYHHHFHIFHKSVKLFILHSRAFILLKTLAAKIIGCHIQCLLLQRLHFTYSPLVYVLQILTPK